MGKMCKSKRMETENNKNRKETEETGRKRTKSLPNKSVHGRA